LVETVLFVNSFIDDRCDSAKVPEGRCDRFHADALSLVFAVNGKKRTELFFIPLLAIYISRFIMSGYHLPKKFYFFLKGRYS
jgi:hypothetical protein